MILCTLFHFKFRLNGITAQINTVYRTFFKNRFFITKISTQIRVGKCSNSSVSISSVLIFLVWLKFQIYSNYSFKIPIQIIKMKNKKIIIKNRIWSKEFLTTEFNFTILNTFIVECSFSALQLRKAMEKHHIFVERLLKNFNDIWHILLLLVRCVRTILIFSSLHFTQQINAKKTISKT